MKTIKIFTDCSGVKADAIEGVIKSKEGVSFVEKIFVLPARTHTTPLSDFDFNLVLKQRMPDLINNTQRDGYCATIQRGYFSDGYLWHLQAGVSVCSIDGIIMRSKTASVPLPIEVSEKKSSNRDLNLRIILKEFFPSWDEKISVYELLTKENEKEWLQEPLRYCLKRF